LAPNALRAEEAKADTSIHPGAVAGFPRKLPVSLSRSMPNRARLDGSLQNDSVVDFTPGARFGWLLENTASSGVQLTAERLGIALCAFFEEIADGHRRFSATGFPRSCSLHGLRHYGLHLQHAEIPREPLKFRARDFKVVGGGNAATAAVAIARLGGRAHLIARLGDDLIGDAIVRELDGYGVASSLVHRFPSCASSLSSILIGENGERWIVSYFDPKISHEPDWLPQFLPAVGAVLADAHWLEGDLELFRRARPPASPPFWMPTCPPALRN